MTTILPVFGEGEQRPLDVLARAAFWVALAMPPLKRHPIHAGILPADDVEREELDLSIPYGFLGDRLGWWAWSDISGELVIEQRLPDGTVLNRWVKQQTLSSYHTKGGGLKRGRYPMVDTSDIPAWLRSALAPYVQLPTKGDRRYPVHRILAALWFAINLNPPGEDALHVHHRDHDTRNNQVDNLEPLVPAIHATRHSDFRWGMSAYNDEGTVGSTACERTEADFIWLHQFLAEQDVA